MATSGAMIIAASHAPSLLNVPTKNSNIVTMHRIGDETVVYPLTREILEALDELGPSLGFDRYSWLAVVRGVIAVEGEHDRLVLQRFFSSQLSAARIMVIPMRGSNKLHALLDSELLSRLHVPLRVLLDDTPALLNLAEVASLSKEQRTWHKFLALVPEGSDVEQINFAEPDIICALPEAAVSRAYPNANFVGWAAIVSAWRSLERRDLPGGFKGFALKRIGLAAQNVGPDDFLRRVLAVARPGEDPPADLAHAVQAAIASIQQPLH